MPETEELKFKAVMDTKEADKKLNDLLAKLDIDYRLNLGFGDEWKNDLSSIKKTLDAISKETEKIKEVEKNGGLTEELAKEKERLETLKKMSLEYEKQAKFKLIGINGDFLSDKSLETLVEASENIEKYKKNIGDIKSIEKEINTFKFAKAGKFTDDDIRALREMQDELEKKRSEISSNTAGAQVEINEAINKADEEITARKEREQVEKAQAGFKIESLLPSNLLGKAFEKGNTQINDFRKKYIDSIKNSDSFKNDLALNKQLRNKVKSGEELSDKEKSDLELTNKSIASLRLRETMTNAGQYALNSVKNFGVAVSKVFDMMGLSLKSIMTDVINDVTKALDAKTGVASYDTSSSLFSNSTARNQQMEYGLTSSQNYAFTQAKDMLGITGEDDLMYMNDAQKEKFNQLMDKYSAWYDEMESTGALENLQEAQLEFAEFKQEISMNLLTWFAENKDTIMSIFNFVFSALKTLVTIVGNVLSVLSFGKYKTSSFTSSAEASDATTVSSTTSNKTYNVSSSPSISATAVLNNEQELQNFIDTTNKNTLKGLMSSIDTL